MKISILVTLYSCEILESETIRTLTSSDLDFKNVSLVIWNNGPSFLKCNNLENLTACGFNNVELVETTENKSLSVIYNVFLNMSASDRFVFLDHDSTLNDSYLNDVLHCDDLNVAVPLIEMMGEVRSPTMKGEFRTGPFADKDKFMAIGSGLVISAKVVQLMEQEFNQVFDERFYLYGVDTTFFFRVRKADLSHLVNLVSAFGHSLSRLEKESLATTEFRRVERSYDLGLRLRFYFSQSKYLLWFFVKVLVKRSLGLNTLSVKSIFKAVVFGRHYRDVG